MTTGEGSSDGAASATILKGVVLKLEVVAIPVSNVDCAKAFYAKLGWRLDADFAFDNGFRMVQLTPRGSACSVQFGTNMTSAVPGSQGNYLVVSDIEVARRELATRGVKVSEVFHAGTPGAQFQHDGAGRINGQRPITPRTAPTPLSATRTATGGCYRRLRPAFPGASIAPRRRSPQSTILRTRYVARRPPMVITRSALDSATRAGQTGTPPTWWQSRLGRNCRNEHSP